MKLLKYSLQLIVIFMYLYIGNFISELLSEIIVIPGSIIGMLLLFISLLLGIVKLEHLEETTHFFLKNMGFFFIPLGVSLIESYILIKSVIWQVTLLLLVSNILVMGITAKVTEIFINRKEKRNV